jgi:hypothetical protein
VLVFVVVVMSVSVIVAMPVFVGMAADFHIAAAETASAFFAHKIVNTVAADVSPLYFATPSQSRLTSAATDQRFN